MSQDKQKPFSGVLIQYSSSRFFRLVLGAVTVILRPRLLGPDQYGIWKLFEIIPLYASYLHFGLRDAMRFFIPAYLSKNDYDKVAVIKETVFTTSLFINLFLSCLLVILGVQKGFSIEVRVGFFVMALMILLLFMVEYYIAVLRAYENFGLIAASTYLNAGSLLVLTVPMLYFWKLYGLYITILSAYAITLGFLSLKQHIHIRVNIDNRSLRELFVKGAPIMLSDFTVLLITTSDRVIVSSLLGNRALGYYGIGILIVTFLMQIPGTAREIMEPRLMRVLETTSSEQISNDYLLSPLINTSYLMPFLIGPVFILTPVLIPLILPHYVNGIIPAQILSLGTYFLSLAYVPRTMIVANNLQLKVATILPVILAFNVVVSFMLVRHGLGLEGAAIGSSMAFFVLFVTLIIVLKRGTKWRCDDWKSHIVGMCLPFPLMCLCLAILYSVCPLFISSRILCAVVIMLLLLIAMYIIHAWACRRFRLLKSIRIT
ncbi:MAG: polysaccharide biosynthesis C-terminal domain-containing protein [bacterium]